MSIFDGVYLNFFDKQSESEESMAERAKLRRQRHSEIAERERFDNFLEQSKEEQKDTDMDLFRKYFFYEKPDMIVRVLHNLKIKTNNYEIASLIHNSFKDLADKSKEMPAGTNKNQIIKTLTNVYKILAINEQEQKQRGQGLKILMPNQMLARLSISLAQLKAGNNSGKLKNEIRQLLYSLYQSKTLTENIYESLINII